jgi:hypothetical protein
LINVTPYFWPELGARNFFPPGLLWTIWGDIADGVLINSCMWHIIHMYYNGIFISRNCIAGNCEKTANMSAAGPTCASTAADGALIDVSSTSPSPAAADGPKKRRIAHARQVEAVSCPVFVAEREDLVNFDVFISRIMTEHQAWRYGIAKIVLKPDVYREFFMDPDNTGISWDTAESDCPSLWKTIACLPVTRKLEQVVEKIDNGLFRVHNRRVMMSKDDEPQTVPDFVEEAAARNLIHPPTSPGEDDADEIRSVLEMPRVVYTSEREPFSGDLNLGERTKFWDSLPKDIGGLTQPISYLTELNCEPVSVDEATARLKSSPGRKVLS